MTVTDAEAIILNVCVFVLIVLCIFLLKEEYEYIKFKHTKRMHEIEQEAIEQLRRYRDLEDHERK